MHIYMRQTDTGGAKLANLPETLAGLNLWAIRDPARLVIGMKHHYGGRFYEASQVYHAMLQADPGHAEARFMLGMVSFQVGELEHAEALIRQTARERPDWMLPPYNLGVIYDALGQHGRALACYRRALELRPDFTSALVNLGNSMLGRGDLEGAVTIWERALGADRDSDSEARLNISFALLLQGKWREGWAEYEHRQTVPGHAAANPMPAGIPLWQGEPIDGKRLLIQEEQGMGDTIMLLRYTRLAERAGAVVVWRVPRLLQALLWSFDVAAVPNGEPLTEGFDYCIPSYSLPYRFGTMPATVPPQPEFVG
jgi:Flp pilus assembly protein TadD